ncbi:hypothetical protein D5086_006671 [Populus alba]|uniref:Uncharacterized protein n=1 Tax=Populus alba TaxID=43335 RepID=A0ACC4CLD9_POPAL
MLGIRELTLPRKETAETSHVMPVPGVQAKQMERAIARSTLSAGSACAREGTAKSIVADQISHAVQSTSNRLHLIQQPSSSHVPPSLPSYMLIKILHAYCQANKAPKEPSGKSFYDQEH